MKNGKYLINEVQASEKVYQDLNLVTTNPGGHSSRPVRDNAIYHLAEGLSRLARFDFPVDMNEVSRGYFGRMAGLQTDTGVSADMRAVAGPTPDPQAVARLATASSYYNALMRTTCVATRLSGGHANNALPQSASAIVNCRILPGEAPAAIRQKVIDVMADPTIAVSFVADPKPSQPSPLTPELMNPVEAITKALWPGVIVVPVMGTGATDGLYLRNAGIPTYGLDGIFFDIDDNRMHGKDERVGVKQYFEGLEFQYRLITALSSSRQSTVP
jgi:acetylornithine deacetylase/succinyl-diaminopimelate desuccinylase-like protein